MHRSYEGSFVELKHCRVETATYSTIHVVHTTMHVVHKKIFKTFFGKFFKKYCVLVMVSKSCTGDNNDTVMKTTCFHRRSVLSNGITSHYEVIFKSINGYS